MSPKPASPKKKSPAKKKLAVKADYGGVFFGEVPPVSARMQEEAEPEPEDDPLASYREAAAKAAKAAEKERKEAARDKLFHKIFAAMDSDHDGKVEMADMVEKVSAGTAALSHRAQAQRPQGSVALQLPMVFSLAQFIKEMKRVSSEMDEETFQANVLGLFACFDDAPADAPIVLGPVPGARAAPAGAPAARSSSQGGGGDTPATPRQAAGQATASSVSEAGPSLDRDGMLRELFAAMDLDNDGLIDLNDFLLQARSSEEATELRGLFHFLDHNFGSKEQQITFEAFAEGTLTRTPLGRMRDAPFASALRGMLADVRKASETKAAAQKRLDLLQELFSTLDVANAGTLDAAAFASAAKSDAEREELHATFADMEAAAAAAPGAESEGGGAADGALTFRKYATGLMTATPLGRMKDAAFEKAVGTMISEAKAARPAAAASVDVS